MFIALLEFSNSSGQLKSVALLRAFVYSKLALKISDFPGISLVLLNQVIALLLDCLDALLYTLFFVLGAEGVHLTRRGGHHLETGDLSVAGFQLRIQKSVLFNYFCILLLQLRQFSMESGGSLICTSQFFSPYVLLILEIV